MVIDSMFAFALHKIEYWQLRINEISGHELSIGNQRFFSRFFFHFRRGEFSRSICTATSHSTSWINGSVRAARSHFTADAEYIFIHFLSSQYFNTFFFSWIRNFTRKFRRAIFFLPSYLSFSFMPYSVLGFVFGCCKRPSDMAKNEWMFLLLCFRRTRYRSLSVDAEYWSTVVSQVFKQII